MNLLIAIPLKPFSVAKARLKPVLDARQRSRLGRAIAAHTIEVAAETGAKVAVVTNDPDVSEWSAGQGAQVIPEPDHGGLNGAAAAAVATAQSGGWAILHADLPLLVFEELHSALAKWQPGQIVLAPSYDGGTSLIVGDGPFPFTYGPGSFHRHLGAAGKRAEVVVRRGLALDLDTPRDLESILRINPDLTTAWSRLRGASPGLGR